MRLATGAGSGVVHGLHVPAGFERVTVMDAGSRQAVVIRRRDNLHMLRTREVLSGERVNALIALRMAAEKLERGLAPRCALDRSPGGGPDGFLAVIQHRIDDAAFARRLWDVVPAHCVIDVEAVIAGHTIERWSRVTGGNAVRRRGRIRLHLAQAADAVLKALDRRYGRAMVRRA